MSSISLDAAETPIELLAASLTKWFDLSVHYAVAFSGGVDSAVVASAAALSGADAIMVTAQSASVSAVELADVQRLVADRMLPHLFLETKEVDLPAYRENDLRRCYHCKSELYSQIRNRFPQSVVVSGTNADDLSDYRPGLTAAAEHFVRSPLAELGLGKKEVRRLATYWQLHVADKPASPCLASRIAYGVTVTAERLTMIEQAEAVIRNLGLRELRVRLHADDIARIEVASEQISLLAQDSIRAPLVSALRELGFRRITLDLEGFRSGSMNEVYGIEGVISKQ
ncbi:MAG: ATP-dependent sacrificial sulfur transferase LarE [Planctomycetales bacterium]|nr:ATP-dependent sacrificial sulfur transferase LarE [Planctomycetales bacterium]